MMMTGSRNELTPASGPAVRKALLRGNTAPAADTTSNFTLNTRS